MEKFVVTILAYASIYTTAELRQIQNVLERLKNQKEIERKKYKADNLLESGAVKPAILIYLLFMASMMTAWMENFMGKCMDVLEQRMEECFYMRRRLRCMKPHFRFVKRSRCSRRISIVVKNL